MSNNPNKFQKLENEILKTLGVKVGQKFIVRFVGDYKDRILEFGQRLDIHEFIKSNKGNTTTEVEVEANNLLGRLISGSYDYIKIIFELNSNEILGLRYAEACGFKYIVKQPNGRAIACVKMPLNKDKTEGGWLCGNDSILICLEMPSLRSDTIYNIKELLESIGE